MPICENCGNWVEKLHTSLAGKIVCNSCDPDWIEERKEEKWKLIRFRKSLSFGSVIKRTFKTQHIYEKKEVNE